MGNASWFRYQQKSFIGIDIWEFDQWIVKNWPLDIGKKLVVQCCYQTWLGLVSHPEPKTTKTWNIQATPLRSNGTPKTNSEFIPEKRWLEDYHPFLFWGGRPFFSGANWELWVLERVTVNIIWVCPNLAWNCSLELWRNQAAMPSARLARLNSPQNIRCSKIAEKYL